MTNTPPLKFDAVENLRRHMLLTRGNMAELFGVSRMTYYSWVKGSPIRKSNEVNVRRVLKQLLHVMSQHNWPTAEVVASEPPERMQRLLSLLNS
jgi:DNA-binding XRE family transcriptional regulator